MMMMMTTTMIFLEITTVFVIQTFDLRICQP